MVLCCLAVFLGGCGSDHGVTGGSIDQVPSFPPQPSASASATPISLAQMDTSTGELKTIPIPSDQLLRDPSTGLNDIPLSGEPYDSFNSIAGFSTSAAIMIPFTGPLDPNSVNNNSIIVKAIVNGAPTSIPVNFDISLRQSGNGDIIELLPETPLKPDTTYLVVITNKVTDTNGVSVGSDQTLTVIKSQAGISGDPEAEALRAAYQPIWQAAESVTNQNRKDIPVAIEFTTQPLFGTLQAIENNNKTLAPAPTASPLAVGATQVAAYYASQNLSSAPNSHIGTIIGGTFTDPNFIADPVNGPFQFTNGSALPVQQGTNTVPFLVTLPANATGAVPTLIYQHGVGRSKEDMLIVADAAAQAGFGCIAIDAVDHGDRAIPGQNSEALYFNLNNARMVRDNFRQTVADMIAETSMVNSGNTNFLGSGATLKPNPTYLGQSLGGLLGTLFMAIEPTDTVGTLNVAGGRDAYLFADSDEFGQVIDAFLGNQGIEPNTPEFDEALFIYQTVLDDADPFNYGAHLLKGDLCGNVAHSALLQQAMDDQLIPASATADLARAIGLPQVDAVSVIAGLTQLTSPVMGSGLYQFANAQHGMLIDPSEGPTAEVQGQAVTFDATGLAGAAAATIVNPSTFAAARVSH